MRTLAYFSAAALACACVTTPLSAQTSRPTTVQTPATVMPTPTTPQTPTPTPVPAAGAPQTPSTPSVMPTPPPGTTTPSIADTEHGTSIILLDRIQKVLDEAVTGKSGQVSIDRSMLDEIRAEITQVKLSLQSEKP